jgi:diguanylate cyclase (GGDEF)-like protein
MKRKLTLHRIKNAMGLQASSDELAQEQYRSLTQQLPVLYVVVALNCLFMAFSVWNGVGALKAFLFPVLLIPVMAVRFITWRKRAKDTKALNINTVRSILRGNLIAANMIAFLLGSWNILIMYSAPAEYFVYIPLFTIMSMITCAYCMVALPSSAYSVMVSGTLYIVVAMGLTGELTMIGIAANILLVTVLVTYMVSTQFHTFRKLVDSRSQMQLQTENSRHLAYNDQLTDMPNRRAFLHALNTYRDKYSNSLVAVVMIDMNGFKPINDTYGHAAGDKLLVNAGKCLSDVVGTSGIVARLGGDEFAVLFYNPKGQEWINSRVLMMLYEMNKPILIDEHEIRLGAAFGVCIANTMPEDPMELMRHADIALYDAKNSKLSAISYFEGSMEEHVRRRTLIEQSLSDSMQMAEIEMYFQPIFVLKDGSCSGFEALARWDHPTLGKISPTEFVSAAERCGLATKLTIHLFHQALKTACQWPKNVNLSFNLSGSGLGTSNLDTIIPEILSEMNFCPSRLSVEVTETALLTNPGITQKMLNKLKQIGVRIVLDDFGAGYASIGYLQEMDFDGIKLDGSLISNIEHDEKSRNLLIGVLHLCKSINADVTAEMVESKEQLALLKTLPIKYVQGFLLGGPVSSNNTFEKDSVKEVLRQSLISG